MSTRLNAESRKTQLLDIAISLAAKKGYQNITREAIAKKAKVSEGLVNNYFKTMTQLRAVIMREAIDREILEIIVQGLSAKDAVALKIPIELKQKALLSLTTK